MDPTLALERLYQLQIYSMPRFVLGASPYVDPGDEPLLDVLRHVTVQQEHMASQLAEAILHRGGSLPKETYPMQYTSLHDLELRFLLAQLLDEQRGVVAAVDELAYSLRRDKSARRLAEETRRRETAHLRLFEELCLGYPTTGGRRRDQAHAARELVSAGPKPSAVHAASLKADRDADAATWGLAGRRPYGKTLSALTINRGVLLLRTR